MVPRLEDHIVHVTGFPKAGIPFKDITPLVADPAAFAHCIDEFERATRDLRIEKVAAFDACGFLFGVPLALRLGVPFIPIRKAGKLPRSTVRDHYVGGYSDVTVEIHDDAVKPGERILLVDDVIGIGEGMSCGCRLIEKLGGIVVACAAVIQLAGSVNRLKDRNVIPLLTY